MVLPTTSQDNKLEAPSMIALIQPLNETVSPRLPGRFSELTFGTALVVTEARQMPGTAALTLAHPITKELRCFVRWLCYYGEVLLVLVEESNRTVDPDEGLAAQTILRVVDNKTVSLVDENEFSSMLLVMVDDIKIAAELPPAQWNAKFKADIQKAFCC